MREKTFLSCLLAICLLAVRGISRAGGAHQEGLLAYGVTSVRDMAGWLSWLNALADRGDATSDPVPRYFFGGESFGGSQMASGDANLLIHSQDDARRYARHWHEHGAHFIKVFTSLPWPLHRAVAQEARRLGLPVAGHMSNVERITKSVTLGYAVLEHTMNPRPYDDVLQLLAQVGTRWDPTLRGGYFFLRDEAE
ncbi:hypothetical protein MYX84_16260 [Acidobacteria bacterium AH-259-O06]|nr:hypothetical protein [Acidobacteria bacterium AH-259-O06]